MTTTNLCVKNNTFTISVLGVHQTFVKIPNNWNVSASECTVTSSKIDSDDFWVADTVCTLGLWLKVMGSTIDFKNLEYDSPIVNVSRLAVESFLDALSNLFPGVSFSLLNQAEWEHCSNLGVSVNNAESFVELTSPPCFPVKKYKPDSLGLYSMFGNVWELVSTNTPTSFSIVKGGPASVQADAFVINAGVRRLDLGFRLAARYTVSSRPFFTKVTEYVKSWYSPYCLRCDSWKRLKKEDYGYRCSQCRTLMDSNLEEISTN